MKADRQTHPQQVSMTDVGSGEGWYIQHSVQKMKQIHPEMKGQPRFGIQLQEKELLDVVRSPCGPARCSGPTSNTL